jgi:hypothetical protein
MAIDQDFEVAWLPLNKKIRSFIDLDEKKLRNWVNHMLDSPYSRIADFFATIDTPDESFPAPLNSEAFPILLRLYEQFSDNVPEVAGGKVMD